MFKKIRDWHSIEGAQLHKVTDGFVFLRHERVSVHLVRYRKEHVDLNWLVAIGDQFLQYYRCLLRPAQLTKQASVRQSSCLIVKLERVSVAQVKLCLGEVTLS